MHRIVSLTLMATLSAAPAFAHTGIGDTTSFVHGFMHPLIGLDHVLTMIAVGLCAALLGGRSLWLIPLSFVTMMAFGSALALAGVKIPLVELGIGASVVALGTVVWLRLKAPVALAMSFVGFFAIFHGHAHGAEMPETVSSLEYASGFVTATIMLHGIGIVFGSALGMLAERQSRRAARSAGFAMTLAGIGILFHVI